MEEKGLVVLTTDADTGPYLRGEREENNGSYQQKKSQA